MSNRSSWLESKHLEESPEGAAALERLSRMASADREALIDRGNHFATHSVSLAHRYLVAAVRVYSDAGAHSAADWERAADLLLGPDGSGREAVASFFTLDTTAYEPGEKIDKEKMRRLDLKPHRFHDDWNYTLRPRPAA